MAAFGKIAGQEPSTVTFELRSITHNINSTVMHQEIVSLGGTESSLAVAAVLDTAPASTAWALAVRDVVPNSTTVTVNGNISSNSSVYLPVRLTNGTAFLTPGTDYVDGSTASNIGGPTLTFDNGSNATMRTVSLTQGFPVNVVRETFSSIQSTTVLITSTASTALYDLITSAAGLRYKVYAYMVGSTHTRPSTLIFMSSNAIDRWAITLGSGSSGMTGANMALSPPAWIFATDAANALRVRYEDNSSVISTQIARISISWITE